MSLMAALWLPMATLPLVVGIWGRDTLGVSLGISMLAFLAADAMIKRVGGMLKAAGRFGKDLNKISQPEIPESLGVVVGMVYLVALFCFLPFPFMDWFSQDPIEFPFQKLGEYTAALLSICSMLFLGFADDVLNLKWRHKILLPALATLPLLIIYKVTYGVTFVVVPLQLRAFLGNLVDLGPLYYGYMSAMAIFCTHSINILAGVNGVEVGQSLVIALAILTNSLILIIRDESVHHAQLAAYLILPFVAVGSALLRYNWFPASVFVGDTYCYFAGMTFAVIGILGHFSKTMLLFFTPQIFNFLLSCPQLFGLVPCPRHRLPRLNKETGCLEVSQVTIESGKLKLHGKLALSVLKTLGFVKEFPMKDECRVLSNFTLLNMLLLHFGPMREDRLAALLMALQVGGCAGAFVELVTVLMKLLPSLLLFTFALAAENKYEHKISKLVESNGDQDLQIKYMKQAYEEGNLAAFQMISELFPLNLDSLLLEGLVKDLINLHIDDYIEAIKQNSCTPGLLKYISNLRRTLQESDLSEIDLKCKSLEAIPTSDALLNAIHRGDISEFKSIISKETLDGACPKVKRLVSMIIDGGHMPFLHVLIDSQERKDNFEILTWISDYQTQVDMEELIFEDQLDLLEQSYSGKTSDLSSAKTGELSSVEIGELISTEIEELPSAATGGMSAEIEELHSTVTAEMFSAEIEKLPSTVKGGIFSAETGELPPVSKTSGKEETTEVLQPVEEPEVIPGDVELFSEISHTIHLWKSSDPDANSDFEMFQIGQELFEIHSNTPEWKEFALINSHHQLHVPALINRKFPEWERLLLKKAPNAHGIMVSIGLETSLAKFVQIGDQLADGPTIVIIRWRDGKYIPVDIRDKIGPAEKTKVKLEAGDCLLFLPSTHAKGLDYKSLTGQNPFDLEALSNFRHELQLYLQRPLDLLMLRHL